MIRFSAPHLIWVALPLVAIVLWRLLRLSRDHVGRRRWLIRGTVATAATTALLALTGLEVGARIDRVAVIFVLDRSRSVERAGMSGATDALAALGRSAATRSADDAVGLVVFGSEAATEVLPSRQAALGAVRASVPRDGTDIEEGLRRALADLPAAHAPRIVLITDGVETEGDGIGAATLAAGRGVPIDVLPIERAPRPEVAIHNVRVPATANPDQPVELRIVTRATEGAAVRLRVSRDGETIATSETTVAAGDDVLVMRDLAPAPGVHRYDVLLEPLDPASDASSENNEGGGFMRVFGGSKALVLADVPEEATALADAIQQSGLTVEVGGARRVPADLATMASYDLIVLADLNARRLTAEQMEMLASYERDLGGGLLMVGARNSFGLGGYAYTPVEEVLPATFDLRRQRDRASLAMIIAIDKSGSMTAEAAPGVTKLSLANEAAARSAMLLSPMDRVGVMHVDTEVGWTLPMTSVHNPTSVAAVIRRAEPGGGGIYVDITLRESYAALDAEATQLKHLLLFSDGADSENLGGTEAMVDQALRRGITTSIVSMGTGSDTPALESLSRRGDGRFYIVEDLRELPRIFTQETIEASRSAIVEGSFSPQIADTNQVTAGIAFDRAPAIEGYVVVNARRRSSVLLAASDEDPLLMTWQNGVGRAAVFATDAGSHFLAPWLAWPGYRSLFGQLARDLARPAERDDARVRVSLRDGRGIIRVEAIDEGGRYRNYLDLSGAVADPRGRGATVTLEQTGAGRYEGEFDASAPGPYLITVSDRGGSLVGSAGAVRPSGQELGGEGTDHQKLAQIAALSGGVVRGDLSRVFTDRPAATYAHRPLWPPLLMVSLMSLLLSVAARRLVLPRGLFARLIPARWRRRAARSEAGPTPEVTLAALAAARGRVDKTSGRGEDVVQDNGVAKEIRDAQRAAPSQTPPPVAAPTATPADTPASAAESPPSGSPSSDSRGAPESRAEPGSLAERLLAQRKRRR